MFAVARSGLLGGDGGLELGDRLDVRALGLRAQAEPDVPGRDARRLAEREVDDVPRVGDVRHAGVARAVGERGVQVADERVRREAAAGASAVAVATEVVVPLARALVLLSFLRAAEAPLGCAVLAAAVRGTYGTLARYAFSMCAATAGNSGRLVCGTSRSRCRRMVLAARPTISARIRSWAQPIRARKSVLRKRFS